MCRDTNHEIGAIHVQGKITAKISFILSNNFVHEFSFCYTTQTQDCKTNWHWPGRMSKEPRNNEASKADFPAGYPEVQKLLVLQSKNYWTPEKTNDDIGTEKKFYMDQKAAFDKDVLI